LVARLAGVSDFLRAGTGGTSGENGTVSQYGWSVEVG